jgi:DNA-binding GntR family transcriptional regulator
VKRADWGDVRLVDYDALALLGSANPETLLFKAGTRLSDAGVQWLDDLIHEHRIAERTGDEPKLIELAREFVDQMGVLTTIQAARIMTGLSDPQEPIVEVTE